MTTSSEKENFGQLIKRMKLGEAERIYALSNSVGKILDDAGARMILRHFMESENKSVQCVDIYETCAEFLENHPRYESCEFEILSRLGLPSHLRQRLFYRLNKGDPISISLCLKNIQAECLSEVAVSFSDFKDSITKTRMNLKLKTLG
ncbi:uncharacterized protein LOC6553011 [Drosophila erecta]|uniref:GG10047 n=1 Tax=Drosophila erecta TaxID=7220 RepID=B3P2T8_DROER|nr:uncharacterized protein LOC6553011 [Drosophila erecta]EDV48110.1 uncharacterized protein Dere_GG10047 [Drosophila erecta]